MNRSNKAITKTGDKVVHAIKLYNDGVFGSPNLPNRSSGPKNAFWLCYFGHRKSSEYRGAFAYPWARAGELCAACDEANNCERYII